MDFKAQLITLLEKETGLEKEEITNLLSTPPNPKMGDFAFPCFKLASEQKISPKDAADKLKEQIKLPNWLEKAEITGPYLNFTLNKTILAKEVLTKINEDKENFGKSKQEKKVLVEFCSPNTNKPLHLGHLRNIAIGDSLNKILRFLGNDVKAVQIVNDRGIHICKSMLAYQLFGNNAGPNKKADHFVGDWYVEFSKRAKEDESLNEKAQEMLVKWEAEDKEVRALWRKMNDWVLEGFEETFKRLGIVFDKNYFESEIYMNGKELVQDGFEKGVFEKDEKGAIIADLEDKKLGKKVVLRSDGTSIYITQDLFLVEQRFQDYDFDKLIYITAYEQDRHFQQLFAILEKLGKPYAKKLFHLSYGFVHLPEGRMKSREGTVIDADDLLDELHSLALAEVKERYEGIDEKEANRRAELIGQAAIKYHMLKTDPIRDIIIDPKESLSFTGDTGPYIQYSHARACSILRKASYEEKEVNFEREYGEKELQLINSLRKFNHALTETVRLNKTHMLCNYLLELAQTFNDFYHSCPVITEDKELMQARLLLVDCTRQVLANGLSLLGIKAPEEM